MSSLTMLTVSTPGALGTDASSRNNCVFWFAIFEDSSVSRNTAPLLITAKSGGFEAFPGRFGVTSLNPTNIEQSMQNPAVWILDMLWILPQSPSLSAHQLANTTKTDKSEAGVGPKSLRVWHISMVLRSPGATCAHHKKLTLSST